MSIMTRLLGGAAATAMTAAIVLTPAVAETIKIRVQSVIPTKADEVTMLKDYADTVAALTNGEVQIEVLPAGAVVGVQQTLEAVDQGLIEGGFAWTHYWSGLHPAATLFGSPTAGAGLGIDNIAWVSWYMYGGGRGLYEELWKEMGVNVKGFMLQPVGPEALGWFKEPIETMADFRKYRFRTPPGIPGQTYKDIGIAAVAMGGGDILPALEKGVIDAAEWCCPKPDSVFGFQKVLKHYYLQGLHQVVVNADMYLNGDVWAKLTPHQQKAMEGLLHRIYGCGEQFHGSLQEGKCLLPEGLELHEGIRGYRRSLLGRFTDHQCESWQCLRQSAEEIIRSAGFRGGRLRSPRNPSFQTRFT